MRCIVFIMIAAWLHVGIGHAQMRVVVVPAGSDVVVPARGAAAQATTPRPSVRPRIPRPPLGEVASLSSGSLGSGVLGGGALGGGALGGGTGLAVPLLAMLPLAAAAALATSLPGGGGGTSSPARTR